MVEGRRYRVFVSHASVDSWVARQIEARIRDGGAATFIDSENIASGDDFEEQIIVAAGACDELAVLLTPAALKRRYVWIEIGMFMAARKRIVVISYGVNREALTRDPDLPVVIKRLDRVDINDIESYFVEVAQRARTEKAGDD